MKKSTLLIASLIIAFYCHAQSFEIDSLKKQLETNTKQDTSRVNRLNELCNAFPMLLPEDIERYANEALELSRRLKYSKGEGFALLNLARAESYLNEIDLAESLVLRAEVISKQTGDRSMEALVYLRLGGVYMLKDLRQSISELLKAEKIALELADEKLLMIVQNDLSSRHTSLGELAKAMDYSNSALALAEKLNLPNYKYGALNNLMNIYIHMGDFDRANEHLRNLIDLHRQLGLGNSQLVGLYNGLGENDRLSNRFPEAIASYEMALKYAPSPIDSVVPLSNFADVYLRMDSVQKAFKYAYKSLEMTDRIKDNSMYGWIYGILARAHLREGNLDSAVYYGEMGFKYGQELGIMEDLRDNSGALADAYTRKNDFRKALFNYQNFISYRDSMVNDEVKNKSIVLEHNLELAKKESEIALLNEKQKLQRNFLYSSLIVIALIMVAAFLLLRNSREKQKANRLLLKQKQEIDAKVEELAIQKDNLQKSHNNMELLGEIGRKITSSLSVEKIIGTVYDHVNGLMEASIFGIGIYHDGTKSLDFPATYENGQALPPYSNAVEDPNRLASVCFSSGKEIIIQDLEKDYVHYLQKMPTPIEGKSPASLIYLPLVSKGKLFGVVTVQSFNKNAFTDYHVYMLRSIALYTAIALENAESFNQLNAALNTLRETQTQLIQSEKMASLGELTAGIAHEIQNPLNFVNNFAEVCHELMEELKSEKSKEKSERDENLEDEIIGDVIQNLGKIHHHGKRADAIVKGMLAHSRNTSGQKEDTDLNALADEYLRLSYHGLRAKDKSFNAQFNTDFDPDLPKIPVVPQDIGRVLLNLINNAFFAVNEKKKKGEAGYKPIVSVSTIRLDGKVLITVRDNGPGIPDAIKDKIFQPFFTTKPTGQGTGLGLSLSYDIVKAHGGDLEFETAGYGTNFKVLLPL